MGIPTLAELRARRANDCRLTRDRALGSIDEAEAFLRDRRILTQTRDSSLPSLAEAVHDGAGAAGSPGAAAPISARSFGAALAARPHIQSLKALRGRVVLLSAEGAATFDPLCRDALERAEDGELGEHAALLVRRLKVSGPRPADDLRADLDLATKDFRVARERLEAEGAIVSRPAPAADGALRPSTLLRWDQSFTHRRKAPVAVALDEVVLLGIRAAVVVQEDEPRSWFAWPVPRDTIRRLLETGRLVRPAAGWVAAV